MKPQHQPAVGNHVVLSPAECCRVVRRTAGVEIADLSPQSDEPPEPHIHTAAEIKSSAAQFSGCGVARAYSEVWRHGLSRKQFDAQPWREENRSHFALWIRQKVYLSIERIVRTLNQPVSVICLQRRAGIEFRL